MLVREEPDTIVLRVHKQDITESHFVSHIVLGNIIRIKIELKKPKKDDVFVYE